MKGSRRSRKDLELVAPIGLKDTVTCCWSIELPAVCLPSVPRNYESSCDLLPAIFDDQVLPLKLVTGRTGRSATRGCNTMGPLREWRSGLLNHLHNYLIS